jgi:hypothetical protein
MAERKQERCAVAQIMTEEEIVRELRESGNGLEAQALEDAMGEAQSGAIQNLGKWNEVEKVLRAYYHEPDIEAARVLYAAVAAHDLKGQQVWPMAVAPPGSMKTELIRALDGMKNVYSVDAVTSKTFMSGQIRTPDRGNGAEERPSSLLHRIGESGILLCADFSTVLATKAEERSVIFADLRRIYDGELKKEFGTSDVVPAWKGRLTLVAAVTEAIDRQYAALQSLGDRFVMVRWARAGEEAAVIAMTQNMDEAHASLKRAVHSLFEGISDIEPTLDTTMARRLAALGDFAARGRSYVPREDKVIVGAPQPESATRLAQQLCQLAKGSARLDARPTVSEDDFQLARRAAFDCIPGRRRVILNLCIAGGKHGIKTSTDKYDRDDLLQIGLLDEDGRLSEHGRQLLTRMEPLTESPPNAYKKTPMGVGETSGEAVGLADATAVPHSESEGGSHGGR